MVPVEDAELADDESSLKCSGRSGSWSSSRSSSNSSSESAAMAESFFLAHAFWRSLIVNEDVMEGWDQLRNQGVSVPAGTCSPDRVVRCGSRPGGTGEDGDQQHRLTILRLTTARTIHTLAKNKTCT
jgi:hypothetical protein